MSDDGNRIAGNNGRRLQARAPKPTEWNATKRARFLDHLAATCNVVQSARAVGMSSEAAHALRRRDAGFAELWTAALEAGYQHLEAKLLARALGQDDAARVPGSDPTAVDTGAFDPDAAMRLIQQRNAALAAGASGGARRKTPYAFKHAPIEEVREALMVRLAALARRQARNRQP